MDYLQEFVEWLQGNCEFVEVIVWLDESKRPSPQKAGRRYMVPVGKDVASTKHRFLQLLKQFTYKDILDVRLFDTDMKAAKEDSGVPH